MPSPVSLSVLVPIYNERATIERLLNAVVAVKTGLTVEVLACDDGSTDGTREILSKLTLPGLKVIFMDENVGRGGVIKHLWSVATGRAYGHVHADGAPPPGWHVHLGDRAAHPARGHASSTVPAR